MSFSGLDIRNIQLLRVLCVLVLSGILTAGLWPFHAPRNEVNWLNQGTGLLFGKHGSAVSASPFGANTVQADNSCTLEIWLEPSRIDAPGGMVLAFYWPASGVVPFALRQYRGGLVLEREPHGHFATKAEIYVGDVFSGVEPVLVTISASAASTAIYADGMLLKKTPSFGISSRDLTGRLVIGNAPSTSYSWSGQIKGLAIYDRELADAEVSGSFADWTNGSQSHSAKNANIVARYDFNEGSGNVVHNRVNSATNLLIPERFFLLHQQFLERPWDEYHPGWHYWRDVLVNVVGFIPLGFCFRAYFFTMAKFNRATSITIALGFAVSLTIEVLQAFLPTRDSGMTDLFTNTLGTGLGAILCAWGMKHVRLFPAGYFPLSVNEKEECLVR